MEDVSRLVSSALMALSGVASVSGNLLLLLTLLLNKQLRTDTLGLTLSSSLSDLALGLSIIPLGAYNGLSCPAGCRREGPACQGSAFVFILLQTSSISSFAWVTVARFTEVCLALSSSSVWTPRRSWLLVLLLWVFCSLLAALPLLGLGSYSYSQSRFLCCPTFSPDNSCFVAVWILAGVALPVAATCSLQGYMVHVARKQARRGTFACNQLHCFYVPANNFLRSSMVMLAVLVCLLLCWLPYTSVCLYETFSGVQSPAGVAALSTWLVLAHAALNPWITCMTQTTYRTTVCRIFGRILLCPESHQQNPALPVEPRPHTSPTTSAAPAPAAGPAEHGPNSWASAGAPAHNHGR